MTKVVAPAADTDLVSSVTVQRQVHRPRVPLDIAATVLVGLTGLGVLVRLVLSAPSSGDYSILAPAGGDNAGPAINALVHGHLAAAASNQPLMGLGSIILRAPVAGLAAAFGAGPQLGYAMGALACLLPVLLLVTWMNARPALTRQQHLAAAIAALLVLAGPATAEAVQVGHPEEVLAAALATAAVLAALHNRPDLTWLLLGLAVGTKQWAVLAAPAALLALPERRAAAGVKAGALAVLLAGVLPLANPSAFSHASASVGALTFTNLFSIWWPLGSQIAAGGHGAFAPTAHFLPLGLSRSSAAALGLATALASLWCYALRRGERAHPVDALALLSLCGLARCVIDPAPLHYYYVAVLIPLAAWEVVGLGRLPLVTALATGAAATLMADGGSPLTPGVLSALSLTWSLALGLYLARRCVHAGRSQPMTRRLVRPALAQTGA